MRPTGPRQRLLQPAGEGLDVRLGEQGEVRPRHVHQVDRQLGVVVPAEQRAGGTLSFQARPVQLQIDLARLEQGQPAGTGRSPGR